MHAPLTTTPPPAAAAAPAGPLRVFGPGIAATAAVTAALVAAASAVPAASPIVLALVVGAVAGTAAGVVTRHGPAAAARWDMLAPGTAVIAKQGLRVGVVLLGLQLSVPDILALGWCGLTVTTLTLAATFAGTQVLGRRLGVSRDGALLVATGFAVCGAAAVSAMACVVERTSATERERRQAADDVAAALALVTVYGTAAILVLPFLARVLALTDDQAGLWIGASVQEVAQTVAAAGAVSTAALATATVAKLARVVMLAPLVTGVGAVRAGRSRNRTASTTPNADPVPGRRPAPVPLFVIGFLAAAGVRSLGLLPAGVLAVADSAATALFVAAMFALGLGVDLPRLLRTGRRTLALGALSALLSTVVALTGVLMLA